MDMLYEERGHIWGCEAGTVSMLTKYLLSTALDLSVMMTSMYPFLTGGAALRHERIASFPEVGGDRANRTFAAHCG